MPAPESTRGRLRERGLVAEISKKGKQAGTAGGHEEVGGGADQLLAQRSQEAGVVHRAQGA